VDSGLPGPLKPLLGDVSNPFTDAEILVGGEVPTPCEDTGDLMGEGDLGAVSEGWPAIPGNCIDPRWDVESMLSVCSACSACTTSAKETKLNLRTSGESSVP
jgi:hypothetical protein